MLEGVLLMQSSAVLLMLFLLFAFFRDASSFRLRLEVMDAGATDLRNSFLAGASRRTAPGLSRDLRHLWFASVG